MGAQHEETERPRVGGLDQVEEVGEVAEALGHLLATDLDEAVVHPVAGEGAAGGHRLRSFILMMWEGEILTAAMDVESVAEEIE